MIKSTDFSYLNLCLATLDKKQKYLTPALTFFSQTCPESRSAILAKRSIEILDIISDFGQRNAISINILTALVSSRYFPYESNLIRHILSFVDASCKLVIKDMLMSLIEILALVSNKRLFLGLRFLMHITSYLKDAKDSYTNGERLHSILMAFLIAFESYTFYRSNIEDSILKKFRKEGLLIRRLGSAERRPNQTLEHECGDGLIKKIQSSTFIQKGFRIRTCDPSSFGLLYDPDRVHIEHAFAQNAGTSQGIFRDTHPSKIKYNGLTDYFQTNGLGLNGLITKIKRQCTKKLRGPGLLDEIKDQLSLLHIILFPLFPILSQVNYVFEKSYARIFLPSIKIKDLPLGSQACTLLYKAICFMNFSRSIPHNEVMIRAKPHLKDPTQAICGIVLPTSIRYFTKKEDLDRALEMFLSKLPGRKCYIYDESGTLTLARLGVARQVFLRNFMWQAVKDFVIKMQLVNWNMLCPASFPKKLNRSPSGI